MRSTRAVVAVLILALAVYFGLIGYRGLYLLGQDRIVLKVLGGAVLVMPLIGIWVVVAELRFGRAAQRLTNELGAGPETASIEIPSIEIPRRPSGRIDRDAADEVFTRQRAVVEARPQDWRNWYRLAEAYDIAGDRRRAREAMREAIERHDGVRS